jgi:4-amino-4-deoxy-L-arabinose transferase-like glycosyltransferase
MSPEISLSVAQPRSPRHGAPFDSGSRREEASRYLYIAVLALPLVVALRVLYAFTHHVNGDELQHLHVVWGWTQGLLQYRDVFDNHTPLFHLLMAPLLAALGERPDILIPMRLVMVPLFLGTLGGTYWIGRMLFSRSTGVWAAVLTGLFPLFFLTTVEFRPDDLWMALWVLALAILVTGPGSHRKAWVVGLVLGAAVSVSMKTVALIAALGLAGAWTLFLESRRERTPVRRLGSYLLSGAAGFLLIPGVLVSVFASRKDLGAMYYGVIQHNLVPNLGRWTEGYREQAFLVLALPLLGWGALWLHRTATEQLRVARVLVFLTAALSGAVMYAFWPLLTPQDVLPIAPVAMIFVAAAVTYLGEAWAGRPRSYAAHRRRAALLVPLALATVESVSLLRHEPPLQNRTAQTAETLHEVLEITRPGDFVMDRKGETIFRRRPFYFALETITRFRMSRGLIRDTIPEDLVATRTCVATPDDWVFPTEARRFLRENYLAVGQLRVVGKLLEADKSGSAIPFDLVIPARYEIVAPSGPERGGWLDGKPYLGPLSLTPGHHVFRPPPGTTGPLAVVWARAFDRGLSPFSPAPSRSRS